MKKLFLSLAMMVGFLGLTVVAPAFADDQTKQNIEEICKNNTSSSICADLQDADAEGTFNNTIKSIINTLLYIAGIMSIIMVVISGFRFVTSQGGMGAEGKPGAVAKARKTLIYSIVGLVITVSAFAIVNFVLDNL